jgi:2-polyprenyl-3-methyl-5-hydroxy-6-metoxy-1,4-benzoquinol methylase
VWQEISQSPGLTSEALAEKLGTESLLHRRLVLDRVRLAAARPGGALRHISIRSWAIPRRASILPLPPRVHMAVGEDYQEYVSRFREGTTKPYQEHGEEFVRAGGRVLDVGCGGGLVVVKE